MLKEIIDEGPMYRIKCQSCRRESNWSQAALIAHNFHCAFGCTSKAYNLIDVIREPDKQKAPLQPATPLQEPYVFDFHKFSKTELIDIIRLLTKDRKG